jgi:hypothetical protein
MDKNSLDEIIACLPQERTVFRYARNDFALKLLSRFVGRGMKITDLRHTPFGKLLEKPALQNVLAEIGGGSVTGEVFDYVHAQDRRDFLLTVGRWNQERSRYNQTSRNDENLVLQLNFSREHDDMFARLVGESNISQFELSGHPILLMGERRYYRHTMAWVRMDVELATNEVLIEEVQTDWLRCAPRYLRRFARCDSCCSSTCGRKEQMRREAKNLRVYMENVLMPYYELWDEAAMMAAIQFALDEIGVKTIYYHTFDTGNVLKGMRTSHPPKSLYTKLPRKFCFELTNKAPKMFDKSTAAKRKLRKARNPRWFRLHLRG